MTKNVQFRVERVIGNNVVLVHDPDVRKDLILLGKGLGFSVKPGLMIPFDDPRIEQRFRTDDQTEMTQYQRLTEAVDPKVIQVTEHIFQMIEEDLTAVVNDHAKSALPSHIQFAVYRMKNGMEILNPFLNETKSLYPKEYEVAKKAAEYIGCEFDLEVEEEEVGFLTLHIFSATQHVPVKELVKLSNTLTDMVELIENQMGFSIPRESMDYIRLITHLRFAVERIKLGKTEKNPFIKEIKKKYKEEYKLAVQLSKVMGDNWGYPVPEDEIGYLAMHLYRLLQHYA